MQSVVIGWGRLGGGGIRSFCNRGGCIASQWIASATRNQNSRGVCRYGSLPSRQFTPPLCRTTALSVVAIFLLILNLLLLSTLNVDYSTYLRFYHRPTSSAPRFGHIMSSHGILSTYETLFCIFDNPAYKFEEHILSKSNQRERANKSRTQDDHRTKTHAYRALRLLSMTSNGPGHFERDDDLESTR